MSGGRATDGPHSLGEGWCARACACVHVREMEFTCAPSVIYPALLLRLHCGMRPETPSVLRWGDPLSKHEGLEIYRPRQ